MSSFEMTPFAPGRLSMMTCRPSPADILGWIMRATRSVAPPGGKPTIMRTGFVGAHSADHAHDAAASASSGERGAEPARLVITLIEDHDAPLR